MTYRFRYYYGEGVRTYGKSVHAGQADFQAASPITAINQFHRFMQMNKEIASDRKTVLRPKLLASDYKVESLHEVYHDASLQRDIAATPIVESRLDYPDSPNPDLSYDHGPALEVVAAGGKGGEEFDFGPNKE